MPVGPSKVRCTIEGCDFDVLFARRATLSAPGDADAGAVYRLSAVTPPTAPPHEASDYAPPPLLVDCPQHPGTKARYLCSRCRAPACTTCAFVFGSGVHLCPTCASAPPSLTPQQRRRGIASAIMVGVTGALFALIFVILHAFLEEPDQKAVDAVGSLLFLTVLASATAGLTLGLTARERNVPTPWYVWVGIVGCGVLLGILLLMVVVGLFAK